MSDHPGSFPPPPVDDGSNVDNAGAGDTLHGFHTVVSSNVRAVACVDGKGVDLFAANDGTDMVLLPMVVTLRVVFHNGEVWEYSEVAVDDAFDLREAKSVGGYFNEYIKTGYTGRQLDPATLQTQEQS